MTCVTPSSFGRESNEPNIYIKFKTSIHIFKLTYYYYSVTELRQVFQLLLRLESGGMAGEIGVMLNIPQPFTVRCRRYTRVIRISHDYFKQLVQPYSDDGKAIITNFVQVWQFIHIAWCYFFHVNTSFITHANHNIKCHLHFFKFAVVL